MDGKKYIFSDSDLSIWQKEIKYVTKIHQNSNFDIQHHNTEIKKVTQNKSDIILNLNQNSKKINIVKFADISSLNNKLRFSISKGTVIIDAKLDLHGFSVNNAYDKLINFLNYSINQRYKKLLIITGKGINSPDNTSIIKESFFDWLQTWEMKASILYINYAHKKHGGNGAFYVFLKKQRYDSTID